MDKKVVMVAMEMKHVNQVIRFVGRPLSLTEVRASTLHPHCTEAQGWWERKDVLVEETG